MLEVEGVLPVYCPAAEEMEVGHAVGIVRCVNDSKDIITYM